MAGVAVVLLMVISACVGASGARTEAPTFDLVTTRALISGQNTRFTQAHVVGDSATIDSMFTADARSLPPGSNAVVGLPAIHVLTMEYLEAGITEFREETVDFYGTADYVVDQGNYVLTYGRPPATERGKYLNVWKNVGGHWKIQTNIWNASTSAPTVK